jgi:hypothetical protein
MRRNLFEFDKIDHPFARRTSMGEVIYSASTLKAFLPSFIVVLVLFLLGLVGVLNGIFRRKEKALVRVAWGCAGVFLWMIALSSGFLVFRAITVGTKVIRVSVNDKQIAHDNCGDSNTCDRHILETQSGSNFYDLEVNEEAYDKAQIDSCYEITYFSRRAVFGPFGPTEQASQVPTYQSISTVTRIETAPCP